MSDFKRTKSGWIKVMRYDCDMCHKEDSAIFEYDNDGRNSFGFCKECHQAMDEEAKNAKQTFSNYWDLDSWKI